MKALSARSIVLAHAIETSASHEALPTPARCQAITQESLHALGKSGSNKDGSGKDGASSKTGFEAFLQDRARRIIAAAQLPPDVRALTQHAEGVSRWAVTGVLLGAFALGFAGHAITDPHRVDLLSPSLIGIVLWNVLVYLILIVSGLRGLLKRKSAALQPLSPTQVRASNAAEAPVALNGWLQKRLLSAWMWSC